MSTPTPPEGYRIVSHSEIPKVPVGAMFLTPGSDVFDASGNIGHPPSPGGTYAIPITKGEMQGGEPYAEMRAEIEAMRKHIAGQDKEATSTWRELEELRACKEQSIICINKQAKIIDALLQIIRE